MEKSSGALLMRIVPLQHATITLPGTNSSPENDGFNLNTSFMGYVSFGESKTMEYQQYLLSVRP